MPDKGNPTPGSEAGAKHGEDKSGCVTKMAPVPPIHQPEQPVRH
jgi:hypothetical protein